MNKQTNNPQTKKINRKRFLFRPLHFVVGLKSQKQQSKTNSVRKTLIFSCDSSSIGSDVCQSVGRSICQSVCWFVCQSVCRSASNKFYRSFMLLVVYICCYYYCSLDYQIILQLYFAFLSFDSSSIGHNVSLSATRIILVLCCWHCIYVVTIIVAQIITAL